MAFAGQSILRPHTDGGYGDLSWLVVYRPIATLPDHRAIAVEAIAMEKAFKARDHASYLDVAHSGGYSWL
jgi:hypothetical protein